MTDASPAQSGPPASETQRPDNQRPDNQRPDNQRPVLGLSARLIVLTIAFVMLAEVLIYVPSIANFRHNWLNDRLAAAQVAAMVIETMPSGGFPKGFEAKLLNELGVEAVVAKIGGQRRLVAGTDMPPSAVRTVNLEHSGWMKLITDAFDILIGRDSTGPMRVIGPGMGPMDEIEMVIDPHPLRAAMLAFSRNILLLSLVISGITAGLVFLALSLMIVRPVRRIATNIMHFENYPQDMSRIIAPSQRSDEIGLAERALARMQRTLASELHQAKHLAALGLAVSKINHDLRNMLAGAQLLSDRLTSLPDPTVQRFAPKLIAALGRASDFCQATLAYGRAAEPAPRRALIGLAPVVAEAADLAGISAQERVAFSADIPAGLTIDADPDQLTRIVLNLLRNGLQALSRAGAAEGAPHLRVVARREGRAVTIRVIDNGPGVSDRVKPHLFAAFQSGSPGGSGLGLAIAAELAALHGGTVELEDDGEPGATFRVSIPDRASPDRPAAAPPA